ncbi:alcohol dehydrogenase catalytic domain-containing protein [Acinetobacter baumannii]|uniref:alcohol dehydrogenase catalytic domain-containing protein n=1 Tax=Acinetobacter baumannii TaxID=470 RepID=UPI0023414525|nr:alcohol dehydrogenase catalytic domain-containing protein [Acinetobacter baumannii]MDC4887082.1 alcohol dehydrogenase catalytic domain-containing protein [Acinetobacter baumannii]MDC4927173.1 alcohol dehydrogenase catalytic domain-containing protein [Acinetobacter baumannii]MDC4941436.1 alcohol dehydrogenase catalytic domain-containing protein [Acinetobacter baumannii]MDK2107217.1 alcohol dehydrogenase catalytic domain-containing protein [Acinetobacter baumannii]MDK2112552.1 alcohol dehydro
MMKSARLHEVGGELKIDEINIPSIGEKDVLIKVKSCNLVPNLKNVMHSYPTWFPFLPLPKLPAIYGLDAAGVIEAVGDKVHGLKVGDKVYVNPGRSCGSCFFCRSQQPINCKSFTFQGYFGFGPGSQKIFDDYPYGGLSEFMTAPADGVVRLGEKITFDEACRFGYIGTAYSALKKANVTSGTTVLITGATGTLGLGAVLCALGMGATKILAVARNVDLLDKLKAIDPERIETLSYGSKNMIEWVNENTEYLGADVYLDTLGPGSPKEVTLDGLNSLRRGGSMVSIGGMDEDLPVPMFNIMTQQKNILSSLWFTVTEGEEMARMAEAGTLDLSVLEHQKYSLEQVNEALTLIDNRTGGFTNVVINL